MDDGATRAHDPFARRDWGEVYEWCAARAGALGADDFDHLAVAAYLLGRERESEQAFERAHAGHARAGDRARAARSAFWLAVTLMLRGEMAPASGWLARAERLAEETGDRALQGLVTIPAFLGALQSGDVETADAVAQAMLETSAVCDDEDLRALAGLSRAQSRLACGDAPGARRLFDEVMVAVMTGEVTPIAAGIVYCAVIDACMQTCDLRRAVEWTNCLQRWCDAQPGIVPYRGQCLVHRSQVLQASGAWTEAVHEVERARRHLSDPPHPALGMALYQAGELHRLRGDLAEAERLYRAASERGRDPRPGLALLRMAEGRVESAAAAVRRMLEESRGQLDRPAVLAAAADVLVADGDVEGARAAAVELSELAGRADVPLLHAMAAYADGRVRLVTGDVPGALSELRRADAVWRDLGMVYESARARVLLGLGCRALGDHDGAALELDAAREVFAQLGATPDVVAVDRARGAARPPTPLTDRECEVLRLVATGRTNREIAMELTISEHTVARHLQNIFLKLDLGSRAAATAYAYEHHLI